jgi:hypothetical protein
MTMTYTRTSSTPEPIGADLNRTARKITAPTSDSLPPDGPTHVRPWTDSTTDHDDAPA